MFVLCRSGILIIHQIIVHIVGMLDAFVIVMWCGVVWCVDDVRRFVRPGLGGVIHFRCWNIDRTVRTVCLLLLFCICCDTHGVIV